MAVIRTKAEYQEKSEIMEYVGNPLISALPKNLEKNDLIKALVKIPVSCEDADRSADPSARLEMLARISTIHIPYAHDLFIARSLRRCICSGYMSRNPMPFELTRQVLQEHNYTVNDHLENYLTRAVFPVFGFSVLGISGVGKSCSVLNALKCYPQVIDHTEYHKVPFHCAQVVWLKIDCAGDGTLKGIGTAILQGLDAVLDTHYLSEISNRVSKDMLVSKVAACLKAHHLGVLVIDDIQNLQGVKRATSTDTLSFLINLMETLAIPVVMVGTPKVLPLFQQEFQLAKRATGDGTVRMDLLAPETSEWERFIKNIWNCQYTRKQVPLTPEFSNVFYHESVGNPFLCSLLYKLVQDDAITSGCETFTEKDVQKVAREKLCITNRMRQNMLEGKDEELNRYEYFWSAATMPVIESDIDSCLRSSDNTAARNDLKSAIVTRLLHDFGISTVQAEKLASQVIAAVGTEDQAKAVGYAIKLCRAALSEPDNNDSATAVKEDSENA